MNLNPNDNPSSTDINKQASQPCYAPTAYCDPSISVKQRMKALDDEIRCIEYVRCTVAGCRGVAPKGSQCVICTTGEMESSLSEEDALTLRSKYGIF